MPYIERNSRKRAERKPSTVGELNYAITELLRGYVNRTGGLSYQKINDVVGALECCKQEVYRRIAAEYEDGAILINSDVFATASRSKGVQI